MLLRPRQREFVERSLHALGTHGNTLGVAPTGAGKTIMLSAVTGQLLAGTSAKACVLAHRDELTAQNRTKFGRVHPDVTTSVVDAGEKSWAGQVTFAMAPTLSRAANLDAMPALDLLVIDEAHHATADSYRRIVDRVRLRNPDASIFGVTATPNRGDRKGLRAVFSNVADQIRVGELIASGHLVPPRTFVIDVGVADELASVRRTADDFDMAAVEAVMNRAPVTDAVIAHWREKAGNRPTVVFCSTVAHARDVAAAFNAADVPALMVTGDMGETERRNVLHAFTSGEAQVIVNVAVLTEGWDHPPVSCVVLLRPSSYKSTMIQMVGRGLRVVDAAEFPGVVKTDCVVLDFGISSLLHGCLEQDVDLDGHVASGDAPTKTCPECEAQGSSEDHHSPASKLQGIAVVLVRSVQCQPADRRTVSRLRLCRDLRKWLRPAVALVLPRRGTSGCRRFQRDSRQPNAFLMIRCRASVSAAWVPISSWITARASIPSALAGNSFPEGKRRPSYPRSSARSCRCAWAATRTPHDRHVSCD